MIVPQLTRLPQPTFSAAMVAYVEVHYEGDEKKNPLCTTVQFPDSRKQNPQTTVGNRMSQFQWSRDKALRKWILASRLDGFGKSMASVAPDGTPKQVLLADFCDEGGGK